MTQSTQKRQKNPRAGRLLRCPLPAPQMSPGLQEADRRAFVRAGGAGQEARTAAPPHLTLAPGLGGRAEKLCRTESSVLKRRSPSPRCTASAAELRRRRAPEFVLPDLPLDLHRAGPVQLLVGHHQLQLLLRNLQNRQATVSSTLPWQSPSRQPAGLSTPTAETTSIPAQLMGTPGTGPRAMAWAGTTDSFSPEGLHTPEPCKLQGQLGSRDKLSAGNRAPKLSLQGQAAQEPSPEGSQPGSCYLGQVFHDTHHHRLQRRHLHQREALLSRSSSSYTWELTLLREQSPAGPQTGSATGVPFSRTAVQPWGGERC